MSAINNSKFVKVNDCLYNTQCIKSIECNDYACKITIANTVTSHGQYGSTNNDITHSCLNNENSECYKKLKLMVDTL